MIFAQPITVMGSSGIQSNYAQSVNATNSITAHNGERCTEHFYAGFDYPTECCLYCGAEISVLLAGDVNTDRYVTNSDLTLLVRVLSGWVKPSEYCDLDKNGKYNNRDAIALVKILAE